MPRVKLAALAVIPMLLAAPAAAQRASVQDRLTAALDTAVQEHEIFLNCSATDRQAHMLIRRGWEDMVRDAIAALEAANADAETLKQYRERTDADSLSRRTRVVSGSSMLILTPTPRPYQPASA